MYEGKYVDISDFSGGYCGNISPLNLGLNQASYCLDIVLLPNAKGFKRIAGDTTFTASAIGSGVNVRGLGYLNTVSGSQYLVATGTTKVYATNSSLGTTFSDVTGAVTLTNATTYRTTYLTFTDAIMGFHGSLTASDAPFKYTGIGNASALGGSPPSGYGAFTTNNRLFIFNTAANPSTLYWSVLGDGENWSGVGSGSAVVGSLSENDKVTASAILSNNTVLLFKTNSTWQMSVTTAPFPIFSLFKTTGCVGKDATIVVGNTCYWINQFGRMVSTTGASIQEYSDSADDLWNAIPSSALSLTIGYRENIADHDWLVWNVNTSSSANPETVQIVWDLTNKCWLRNNTSMMSHTLDKSNTHYIADHQGVVYTTRTNTAATNAAGSFGGIWRTGWLNTGAMEQIMQVNEIGVAYNVATGGTITVVYGFDFYPIGTGINGNGYSISRTPVGTETHATHRDRVNGRGNFIQISVGDGNLTAPAVEIHKVMLRGKMYGQKEITNP